MRGVALKAAYNDGGPTTKGGLVGFRDVCSDGVILHNVRAKLPNCADPTCPCCIFASNNFTGHRPSLLLQKEWCYESTLLRGESPWKFGAGVYHNGSRKGQPIPAHQVEVGDVAFLTTRKPNTDESSRFIFAIFRIGKIEDDDPHFGKKLVSDSSMEVRVPDDVAPLLAFWRYYSNKSGGPFWGSGLVRYLGEEVTKAILSEIMFGLGNRTGRDLIYEALKGTVLPRAPGTGGVECLPRPESPEHLMLKNRVAANPALIGLPSTANPRLEHVFPHTGDRVDILFDLADGTAAVVEIETTQDMPGAHQCIKYRALLEAERGKPLNSGGVQAVLVAYRFKAETVAFAKRYDVRLVALPP